ncbi:unnamed protein product, partial [Amoebophrya sp. A25]
EVLQVVATKSTVASTTGAETTPDDGGKAHLVSTGLPENAHRPDALTTRQDTLSAPPRPAEQDAVVLEEDAAPPPPSAWPCSPGSDTDEDEADDAVAELPIGEGLPGTATKSAFMQRRNTAPAWADDVGGHQAVRSSTLLARSRQNSLSVFVTTVHEDEPLDASTAGIFNAMAPNIKETGTIGSNKDTVVAEAKDPITAQRRRSSLTVPTRRSSVPGRRASLSGDRAASQATKSKRLQQIKKENRRKENPFTQIFSTYT